MQPKLAGMASDQLAQTVLERVRLLQEILPHITDERLRRRIEDMLLPAVELDTDRWALLEARVSALEAEISRREQ